MHNPLSENELVQRLAGLFERAWHGKRPHVADYLLVQSEEGRSGLLFELLVSELEFRTHLGETPELDEYVQCPQEIVARAFEAHQARNSADRLSPGFRCNNCERFEKLEAEPAAGGMGLVYRALDRQFDREVAWKQPNDEPGASHHFENEIKVTARLEHPNVVPVYGRGRRDDRPYFVMRLIKDKSLDKYIRALHDSDQSEKVELRKLLQDFTIVCRTVGFAHTRKIVHRDLKPSNIMLGPYGETLVVDWGLATKYDGVGPTPVAVDTSISAEEDRAKAGTPGYWSPEPEASPRSDIYSLGATLFAIVTGESPRGLSFRAEPDRLRLDRSAKLWALLSKLGNTRALARIISRAMAYNPKDRYQDAVDLAVDVENWLADEPISAHEDSPVERVQRLLRRPGAIPRAITLASLIFLSCLIAMVSLTWAWNQTVASKRTVAEAQAKTLEWLQTTQTAAVEMSSAAADLRHLPSAEPIQLRMLDRAARSLEKIAGEEQAAASLEIARSKTNMQLGDIYASRPSSVELQEAKTAYRTARGILEKTVQANPDVLDAQIELANSYTRFGNLYANAGDQLANEEFSEAARRLTALLKKLRHGPAPQRRRCQDGLATALFGRARSGVRAGRYTVAERDLLDAREAFLAVDPSAGGGDRLNEELAECHRLLGFIQLEMGRGEEAVKEFNSAIEGLQKLPEYSPAYTANQAAAFLQSSFAYHNLGRRNQRMEALRSAMAVCERLRALGSHADYLEQTALSRTYMARAHYDQGGTSDAVELMTQAYDDFLQLVALAPESQEYQEEFATWHLIWAIIRSSLDENQEALDDLSESIPFLEAALSNQPDTPRLIRSLATTFSHQGQIITKDAEQRNKGRKSFENALGYAERLTQLAPEVLVYQFELAEILVHQSTLLRALGDAGADVAFGRAVQIWQTKLNGAGLDPRFDHLLAWHICKEERTRSEYSLALRAAEEAAAAASDNPDYLSVLGLARYRNGDADSCIENVNKAVRLRGGTGNALDCFCLALATSSKSLETAKAWLRDGLNSMTSSRPGDPDLLRLYEEARKLLDEAESAGV